MSAYAPTRESVNVSTKMAKRQPRKQKKLLDAGEMTMKDIETSFQCWQAGLLQQKSYMQVLQMLGRRAPEWNPKKRRYKMHEEIIFTSISDQESRETSIAGGWKLFPEETWTMQQKPQETTATPC